MSLAYWAVSGQSKGENAMKMRYLTSQGRILTAFFVALAAGAHSARADMIYNISMDTSALVGNLAGPFYLDFQFNDGSGSFDGNNTVTVGGFNVAGVGAATPSGGGTGDLGSSVVLTDSGFFNEVFQQFTPASTLQFQIGLTTNVDPGPTPDEFTFGILWGSSLFDIPTTSANNAFLTVDITSPLTITSSASDPNQSLGANPGVNIAAPTAALQGTAVPEPASLWLVITVLGMLVLFRWGRRLRLPTRRFRVSAGETACPTLWELNPSRTAGPPSTAAPARPVLQ
jgi:hypothetical protein